MLDKSIPYGAVIMIKEDPQNWPHCTLPEGYSFVPYRHGMEVEWAQVQKAAGHVDTVEKGLEIFNNDFALQPKELNPRLVMVQAPDGKMVGTCALWRGTLFEEERQKIHWVSVDDEHAGKGIAKAMLSRCMEIYAALGCKGPLYLETQTWSYPAINIYKKFGFAPYLKEKPAHYKGEYSPETLAGHWEIIDAKIGEYR